METSSGGTPLFRTAPKFWNLIMNRKRIILKNKASNNELFKKLIAVLVSLFILPIIFTFLFVFKIYQNIVVLILRRRYGLKFGGLLNGTDTVWAIEDTSKSIINILMILQYNNGSQEFQKTIKETLKKNLFKENYFPKILSTFHKAYGYYYLLNNDIKVEDCIKELPIDLKKKSIEKSELIEMISSKANEPLPKNHTAFWDVLIGQQPINWVPEGTYFPIVFRVHHSLADGASLLKILIGIFADKRILIQSFKSDCSTKFSIQSCLSSLKTQVFNYFKTIGTLLLASSVIKTQNDENIVHGPTLSGKKMLFMEIEELKHCVDIIKRIKNKCWDTTFSDVLLTAISRSFNRFFNQYSKGKVPQNITAVIPANPGILQSSLNSDLESTHRIINLSNAFSVAMLTIPTSGKLEDIKKNTKALRHSVDYQINFWLISVISGIIPEGLLKPLLQSTQSTLVISSVPGPELLTIFNGCKLQDMVFWIPHRGTTGIGLSVLSYDGRFQMGISVDETLIPSGCNMQNLVEDIRENLILMENEVGAKS